MIYEYIPNFAEAYLEPSRTSAIELFSENNDQKPLDIFAK